eukprot:6430416-Amphidinium_carterae.1
MVSPSFMNFAGEGAFFAGILLAGAARTARCLRCVSTCSPARLPNETRSREQWPLVKVRLLLGEKSCGAVNQTIPNRSRLQK